MSEQLKLSVIPCELDEANAFVKQHHRHHGKVVGHKFSLAVADEGGTIRGVAIIGRPVARGLDDGMTLEVTRVATDGCKNACSALYGAAWRATKALGYRRVVTYTLDTESGQSLAGSGWRIVAEIKGDTWDRPGRPRIDKHPTQGKFRWEPKTCPPHRTISSEVSTRKSGENIGSETESAAGSSTELLTLPTPEGGGFSVQRDEPLR